MASTAITRHPPRIPKVLQPASPFGELLRRSNFAAYDPTIRQTYAAPPSYVHRGNWGLKRPIANRVRHSAIVLRQFEEHAHYIEWDKAPAQVDFVRRVEALNIAPQLEPNTPWMLSLGPAADAIDSDFCAPTAVPAWRSAESVREAVAGPAPDETFRIPKTMRGRGVGRRVGLGAEDLPANVPAKAEREAGGYGKKAEPTVVPPPVAPRADAESYIQPNVAAMTPTQFEAYLAELRALRPQFKAYLRAEIEKQRGDKEKGRRINPESLSDDELILNLGEEAKDKGLHRYFLGAHTRAKFDVYSDAADKKLSPKEAAAAANTPQPIQGQPHKFGGLVYSKPTKLETYFSGRAEPGLVLQKLSAVGTDSFHKADSNGFITAFAGMSARLKKEKIAPGPHNAVTPLFHPCTEEGIIAPLEVNAAGTGTVRHLKPSIHDMRMIELRLQAPPKVVGRHVINQTMLGVKVDANVAMEATGELHSRANPHRPGSLAFNAQGVVSKQKNNFSQLKSSWAAGSLRGQPVLPYNRASKPRVAVAEKAPESGP
ncbi:hypothetical protein HYPSUDRAFT_200802 [Hypholoma sublateritium FD-334 SS-4]|uniref:Uncharacterized protein n=1 Tax=Hypholoma sublateritium (strain FD-334 SS-4) TaxID=945553 RepID=A0A0D2P054_HYPSF|nr:hypothetical protein HYPSUDRAFT_200802 [Hypholoma sublateritium FD-334 SS-4]